MSITRGDVIKIGKLAALKLSASDIDYYVKELNAVVGWIEQLQNVDVDGIEAMSSVYGVLHELAPVVVEKMVRDETKIAQDHPNMILTGGCTLPIRKDVEEMNNSREDVLCNAHSAKYGYFTVPKIV